jgi:uncharacterized phage protein (TIGR01671 family)
MREIKFRFWDKTNKVILRAESMAFAKNDKPCKVCGDNGIDYILVYRGDDQLEIMQYTGLKDKDGKEVYEGDIILKRCEYNRQTYKCWYEVIYEDTGFYLKLLNSYAVDSYAVVNAGIIVSFPYGDFYVIGNIYENPELLKDKKYKK